MRRGVLFAVALAGVSVGLVGELATITNGQRPVVALVDLAVGFTYMGAGLVAWGRRRENRVGPLLIAFGFAWFIGAWGNVGVPIATSAPPLSDFDQVRVVIWFDALSQAILAHLMLAFPSGRLMTRAARVVVVAAYANVLFLGFSRAVTIDFFFGGEGFQGVLGLFPDFDLANNLHRVYEAVGICLLLSVVAILLYRWRNATPATRRALAPLWLAGVAFAVSITMAAPTIVGGGSNTRIEAVCCTGGLGYPGGAYLEIPLQAREILFWLARAGQLLVPTAFLFGLLRMRLAHLGVSELVLELGDSPPPGRLRDALARALRDPSLQLAFWLPEAGNYVDTEGKPIDLPVEGSGRAYTALEKRGQPLAAIVHDEALAEQGELVRAVGAAAGLALENERLHAELRAQLEEVRSSRARIVEAADVERRRVERDLHDGAQQRLVTLALSLQMARKVAGPNADSRLSTSLQEAADELTLALSELRELARGIHPAILTEDGLGPALASLAERSPVPTTLRSAPDQRLPPAVEATAYFVACEALTNVAKHAKASQVEITAIVGDGQLRLEVVDDGVGGADIDKGTGLRGMADRVAALDGRFEITSAGNGTTLLAVVPCE